ncbi:hypothetical protein [Stutzerimonas stutzeri]|uniref:Toluene tolerance protein n=1 Tax=Stutzerimonas stutzeri KOS6 TaxID=1218352 RepID=A0A061JV05_STUST|nr:hypothetical protein [Stutzerimonas stutzeri]EWC42270.1 toluene tolerance protein [Stutzerimonas stutzeri KOS6]
MHFLKESEYLALRQSAEVVEADHFGDKVLRLADGTYLKLFRRKRLLTSAIFYPYAQRFADNASILSRLGVPCPKIKASYRIQSIARDAVHYSPLAGLTLRQLSEANERQPELQIKLGSFISRLHDKGIYFRSLHLGNIIETPTGELGLIDIADLSFHRKPLSTGQRLRNFKHITRYPNDRNWIALEKSKFLASYKESSLSKTKLNEEKLLMLLDANP